MNRTAETYPKLNKLPLRTTPLRHGGRLRQQ
jgi:hypothetical protein